MAAPTFLISLLLNRATRPAAHKFPNRAGINREFMAWGGRGGGGWREKQSRREGGGDEKDLRPWGKTPDFPNLFDFSEQYTVTLL